MHFSNVLLPDPLRPTMPKNSPRGTEKETSCSACSRSAPVRLNGCIARSFSVVICSWGISKDFETPSTSTAGARSRDRATARNGSEQGPADTLHRMRHRLAGRVRARLLAPVLDQQRTTTETLSARIDALQARVDELAALPRVDADGLERRLQAHDRMRREAVEALREKQARHENAVAPVLALRELHDLAGVAPDLLELVNAARALPFMAGDAPRVMAGDAGTTVLGYEEDARAQVGASPYRSFEAVFRGDEERVADAQRPYLELLADAAPVLDAGSGRGELLDLLSDAGVAATGVDLDPGMVARGREKGHEVAEDDVVAHLEGLADDSLGAVFSAQLIEHLPYGELLRVLELSAAKLRPGGRFIAETVNPHCPRALKAFWLDPTHQHPLFPEVVLVLARIAGFPSGYVFHPLGTGDLDRDRYTQDAYAIAATAGG